MSRFVGHGCWELVRICSPFGPHFKHWAQERSPEIEMLLGASTREVELATITISDVNRNTSMPVEVIKVDKGHLFRTNSGAF